MHTARSQIRQASDRIVVAVFFCKHLVFVVSSAGSPHHHVPLHIRRLTCHGVLSQHQLDGPTHVVSRIAFCVLVRSLKQHHL